MRSEKIGHCLTSYYVDNFDDMVKEFKKFAVASQFIDMPDFVDLNSRHLGIMITESPNFGYGEKLYGIRENGITVFLAEIVDSSG